MSFEYSVISMQSLLEKPSPKPYVFVPEHAPYPSNQPRPQGCKCSGKTAFALITAMPNILQISAAVPNLSRNTPAMPMVASAAKHKLSGFFMPGSFSA